MSILAKHPARENHGVEQEDRVGDHSRQHQPDGAHDHEIVDAVEVVNLV